MTTRPKNIIFVMADQMAACHVNCYGSGVPSTPALDALAARGMRFDRCYSTSPVCTPNRATLLTGRSPAVHGMVSNNYTLPADTATYAQVLGHHGYHVGGFGKFHHSPMPLPHPPDFAYLGFDETVITEDPKWEAYIDWIRTEHPEHLEEALAVAWGNPRTWEGVPAPYNTPEALRELRQHILKPLCEGNKWDNIYTSPLPAELHQTTWITDLALDYMKRRSSEAQPFFCFVSYVDPRDPYDPPEPYDRLFDPAAMPDPIPAAWQEEGSAILEKAQVWGGFEAVADDLDEIRRFRAHYHGSIKLVDDQIARLIEYVDAQGLWEDTIIVFTTDHGEMCGDHGLTTKGFKPYDAGIRCPLIVAGGDVRPGVSDRLVCGLDFFPSFCDWAAVDESVRPPLEGKSFTQICRGGDQDEPWESVSVAFGPMETVINADGWRLTLFDDPHSPNQLINLRQDPTEQHNRYADPACERVRTHLLEQMAAHNIRIRRTPQYRNLPVVDGLKVTPCGQGNGQLGNPIPVYCDPGQTPSW